MLSPANTSSPLHIASRLQTFKDMNMCLHLQSCKLVHVSGVCCLQVVVFFYFIIQYCREYSLFTASPGRLEASIKAKVCS